MVRDGLHRERIACFGCCLYTNYKQANSVPFSAANPYRTFSRLNALVALHFVATPIEVMLSLAVQFDPDKPLIGQYAPQPPIFISP
jgi:hypothetical protein